MLLSAKVSVLSARPSAGRPSRRPAASTVPRASSKQAYVSPSSRTSSTELESLEALSTVRWDRRFAPPCASRNSARNWAGRAGFREPPRRDRLSPKRALKTGLQVVPDVLLSQSLQQVEAPKAATSSRSVLAGIMGNPVSMRRYKVRRPC